MILLIKVMVVCAVVTTTIASDCTVCLRQRCHASVNFFEGEFKLPSAKMGIDQKANIMYYNDNGLKAIDLTNNVMHPITTQQHGNSQLSIDDVTGDVYYYKHDADTVTIYQYQPKTNETKATVISSPDNTQTPLKLWVHNGTIYFTKNHDERTGLNVIKGSTIERFAPLENIAITNIVFDKFGDMYIKAGAEIYRLKVNEEKPILFAESKYLLSVDANGVVIFFDVTKRYIYEMDVNTSHLYQIGAYDAARDGRKRPNLKEYMFDKNNNVIFKDKWSTLYYKTSEESAKCEYSFDEARSRTRITKV